MFINTPDGDANTLGGCETRVDNGDVVVGSSSINVKLGNGNLLDVGTSEDLESSRETRGRVPATGLGKMSLGTDAIDGNTLRHPLVDVINHSAGNLGVVGDVEVVVVDVELGSWVGGAGSAESDTDKVLAENLVELTVSHVSVLSEDLVDNVPVEDLALVAGDHGLDVVLDDRGHGGAVTDVLDPLGKLRVPQESVATDLLAIGLGKVDDLVSVAEVLTLNGIPLHTVLVGDLTKVLLDDVDERVVVEMVVVDLSTEIDLALGPDLGVKTSGISVAITRRRRAGVGGSTAAVVTSRNTLVVEVVDLLTLQARLASRGARPADSRLGKSRRGESNDES
ncbi:hypothetical protein HG531_012245 [Fusarium graminearum]|nr:hypothetical protein HG531_012245 [Fusarium graminearum]